VLISYGANVNHVTTVNRSALDYAEAAGFTEIMELLVAAGATR
jgi:ankyrin repeat protein